MAKAVLVMDMPKRCADCQLRCSIEVNEPFCYSTMQNVTEEEYYKEKPSWCPLKPMPEKQTEESIHCYCPYEDGWNDCLDAIQGKE
jgi:hypothetical protein